MTPQDEYLETCVMTAQPHQLHLMVLDGAIRFAKRADAAIGETDYETAHLALSSSRDFVAELISGLDRAHAPELVDRLKALFVFVYRHLIQADLEHDSQLVRDALKILPPVRLGNLVRAQPLRHPQGVSHGQDAGGVDRIHPGDEIEDTGEVDGPPGSVDPEIPLLFEEVDCLVL